MRQLVFDSWALLEWLLGAPGAPKVRALLEDANTGNCQIAMSWINAGEVAYMLLRKRNQQASEDFLANLRALPIRLALPSADSILAAARIKAVSRLSYADAFAVELAISRGAEIVTGDPEIAALDAIHVVWVG